MLTRALAGIGVQTPEYRTIATHVFYQYWGCCAYRSRPMVNPLFAADSTLRRCTSGPCVGEWGGEKYGGYFGGGGSGEGGE
jgi:hypothetical protein